MRTTLALLVLACGVGAFGFAQTSDVQRLQDTVKQSEQFTEELNARSTAMDESQPASHQVANASIAQPAAAAPQQPA